LQPVPRIGHTLLKAAPFAIKNHSPATRLLYYDSRAKNAIQAFFVVSRTGCAQKYDFSDVLSG
jgi:hypothetical protein